MPVTFLDKRTLDLKDLIEKNLLSDDSESDNVQSDVPSDVDLDVVTISSHENKREISPESLEDGTSSPEIKYVAPVRYTFVERKNNTTIILKKTMVGKRPRRAALSMQEIEKDLSDTDEDEIFVADSRTRSNNQSEREIPRMTLRRSTEQSNWKVNEQSDETRKRRSSQRTVVPPARYRADSRDSSQKKRLANLSEISPTESSPEEMPSRRSTRSQRQNYNEEDSKNLLLPSKPQVLTSILSTPRRRRVIHADLSPERQRGKENKSEDDLELPIKNLTVQDEVQTPRSKRKASQAVERGHTTPKKRITFAEDVEMSSPKQSPPQTVNTTSRRTPRRTVKEVSPDATPKRTPRRAATEVSPDATPKRTPRRAVSETPKRTPLRVNLLTPSMRQRTGAVGKPATLLQEARAQLHVSAVPKSLPCREKEFNDVFTFLQRKLLDGSGGCIYISGVPGTGKTATVNEVVRCLRKLVTKGALEPFEYVEVNGMKLSEPRQAYVQILRQLTGRTATWEQASAALADRFCKKKTSQTDSMTLLVIDELDILCNKRQDVVYNLLDWPAKPDAKLVVVTIANTMDLPERVLMSRVTSRLGLTRLTFQPYNHTQLQEIVITRLNESDAFHSDAIQLVARKVAGVSGDARRALDICRRATEIAESSESDHVTISHVMDAVSEMIASPKVQAIKHCSEMEKVFLQATCAEINRTGVEETCFINIYKQFEALCSFDGVKPPNVTEALRICVRLGDSRLLVTDSTKSDITQRILLNVSPDDVYFALQASLS